MVKKPFQIEYSLLGLLNFGPQHGYSLHLELTHPGGLGRIWRVKQSQLYALLVKLEDAGWITGELQPQETSPSRRVFSITDKGRVAYREWLSAPVRLPHQMRQEFLAKLYFVLKDGPPALPALVKNQIQMCAGWREALERDRDSLDTQSAYDRLVLDFRLAQVEMLRDYLEKIST